MLDELIARHHTPELMARYGARLHPMTRPNFVEAEAIQRVVQWCEATGGQLYIVHMSTAEGADIVRAAQARGVPVLAETCAQYLVLDDSVFEREDGHLFACCPQLKKPKDVERLWQGLRGGEVSVVSTDTCTFTREQKAMWKGDWTKIPMGLPGLETLLPLVYTRGVLGGRLSLEELSMKLSTNPARIMGLYPRKGAIMVGADADLAIIHPTATRTVDPVRDGDQRRLVAVRGLGAGGLRPDDALPRRGDRGSTTPWSAARGAGSGFPARRPGWRRPYAGAGSAPPDAPAALHAHAHRARRGAVTSRAGAAPAPQAASGAEDITRSPLWNPDLAPTPPERRTWSTYNIAALWIGMSVVITTYTLASGLMQQGMNWWQAMVTILLGNTHRARADGAQRARRHQVRHLVPGALPGELRRARRQRPGDAPRDRRVRLVRDPDLDRRRWRSTRCSARRGPAGPRCRAAPPIAFAVLADPGRDHPQGHRGDQAAGELVGAAAARRRCAPAALGRQGTAAASATCSPSRSGCRAGTRRSGRSSRRRSPPSVGYWATLSLNIPDFTRYARSQRSQMLGQALGLPTTMTAFAFIGVAVTSATIVIFGEAIWDPVVLIAPDRRRRGDRVRGAGGPRGAAHDQHGGERRLAVQRLLQPEPEADQLRHRRADHRGDRHPHDAVEALLRRRGVHLHLAARLLEPDGRVRRDPDRGLLGPPPAAADRSTTCSGSRARTPTGNGVNWRAMAALVIAILPVMPGFVAGGGDAGRSGGGSRPSSTGSTRMPGS